jgi:ribosome-binding ATPase YchF (GTP1/OBG family)
MDEQEHTQNDDEELKTWFVSVLESTMGALLQRADKIDEMIDQFEMQLALLTKGYAELAALQEASVSFIINKSSTDKEEFFRHVAEARRTMLDTLNYATQNVEPNSEQSASDTSDSTEGPTDTQSV